MKPSSLTVLLVFFCFINLHFITCFCFAVNSTSAHLCSYDDGRALMEFKNSFTINSNASMNIDSINRDLINRLFDEVPPYQCSPSHPRTNSWHESQDCCYWDGVRCDTTTGEVIGLDLSCSWLQGQLTSNSSLFLLQHLEFLNLAFNNFIGSEIPPRFSQLQRLTHLNLSYSYFQGEVPIEISYLSNLISLDLSDLYTGSGGLTLKRRTMTSLVQNLTDLKELNLNRVHLSSVGSDFLRNISSSLASLELSWLDGIFPANIFYLPNLQSLHLSRCWDLQISLPTSNWSTNSLRELEFYDINLKKVLPSSIWNLKSLKYLSIYQCGIIGSIPDSVRNLTSLEHLDLSYNQLGNTIPASVGHLLGRLQYLDLSGNDLVGSFPNFSNLSSLHTVKLWQNSLNGTIPSSLYSLPLLRTLFISDNPTAGQLQPFQSKVVKTLRLNSCGLQGPIPPTLFPHGANQLTSLELGLNSLNGTIPSSLFTLPSLLYLDLSDNQLVGGIPKFKSTSFNQIKLSRNKLQGNIPSSISALANLTELYFSSNNLSGMIDTSMFSKLQSLTRLDGSNNSLSYTTNVNLNNSLPNLNLFDFSSNDLTEFPTFLRGSKVLSRLDFSSNKIDGPVPNWLWDVGRDTLYYLNLAHNNLTGIHKLPWKNLRYLDLRSNLFQGQLPLPPSTLVAHFISNNLLTGDIPTLICNTSSIEVLDFSRNYFIGTIPECLGNISTLIVLDLSMNKFHGKIPNFSGHEKRKLRTINLNGNQLEGKLPISLVNCENLEVLDIGNNNINDTFPHWLRFITKLRVLVLKSNNFHGYIHDYKYQHNFQKLRIFDISNNNFVGSLPTKYIQGLKAMKEDTQVGTSYLMYMRGVYYDGSYYQDSISLTVKGNMIVFEKILTTFMTVDFSKNKFGGEIVQVLGTLISLKSLNLSHNNLFGHIPSSIGNLRNLESLDLSSNKLDGTVPTELTSLTFLGKLNLSQNVLVGPIPNSNNFDTKFDNNSFQGNLALCGPPLVEKCGTEKRPPILQKEDDSDDDDFDRKIVLYGYVSGLVIGLSIGYVLFSSELPVWLVKMVQHYQRKRRTQRP